MFKKLLFFCFAWVTLHAEPLILLDFHKDKLFFKDGSVYRLTKKDAQIFPETALGSTFEVTKVSKKERNRRYDTMISNSSGKFKALQVAKKSEMRALSFMQRYHEIKNEEKKATSKVFITSIEDRILRLSDGSIFEIQTVPPKTSLEGEEIDLEKVEFYQLKTGPGDRVLLKMIKKPR
jgi:hypothetical protein